jgi:hypothetical protein
LDDADIEEAFVKGSGPGGQKINKVRNCVQLKHLPTGVMVSCQDGRSLVANRAIARKLLEKKVEYETFGADSRIGKSITKKQKQKQQNRRRARLKYHAATNENGPCPEQQIAEEVGGRKPPLEQAHGKDGDLSPSAKVQLMQEDQEDSYEDEDEEGNYDDDDEEVEGGVEENMVTQQLGFVSLGEYLKQGK